VITQPGYINDQYFKVSGGGDKTRYFASVSYQENVGTTVNTGLDRLSTRVNLDYNVSRKIKFSVNFNYSNTAKEDNYILKVNLDGKGGDENVNVRKMAYIKAPNMAIWEHDANGNLTGEYFNPVYSYQGNGDEYFNPVAVADLSINDKNDNIVQNSFSLDYHAVPWMKFRQNISFQYLNTKIKQYLPIDAIGGDWLNELNNKSSEINTATTKITSRSQVFFIPRFQNIDHSLSGSAMMETDMKSSESAAFYTSNGPGGMIFDPAANATIYELQSNSSETRDLGFLGSINYKFKDRYIFSINGRLDGSSKFGTNQRWGLFPSASLGWRFSEEELFSNQTILSDGKFRVSWGQTGKQPGKTYARHSIFLPPDPNQYMDYPVIVQDNVQLDNLKWQTVSSWNVGLDLGLQKDRIIFTAELYQKITSDILWNPYNIPNSSGFTKLAYYNGGALENKGWELFTRMVIIRTENMFWNVNFNLSRNINTFLEFPENFNNERATNIQNGEFPRRADIGLPIGTFYGFRYLGVWPSDEDVVALNAEGNILTDLNGDPIPLTYNNQYAFAGGDAIYEDVNHDGNIDIWDVVNLGDSNPDFIGGFGTVFSWKQLRLSTQFHYRTGFQIVNEVALATEGMLDKYNQSKAVLRRWRIQGQDEPDMIPRAYMDHPANNLGSDRYVEDGDFLRLNNLTFSYEIPKNVCKKIGVNTMDFGFTMRKIYTFTNYSGQDPEIPQKGDDPFWFGTDKARTPIPKSYVLSISVGF
ncbi:MAG: SusC/RagA family TonB-linked outer membrane protein, partial [Bacteroidales bacterium]|nr:SusC/RagA family TonB-linked outer membrane protein [Bacteroidales bacterium]